VLQKNEVRTLKITRKKRRRAVKTHWIGGWVYSIAGLDDMEKRKFLTLPGLELQPLGHPANSHKQSKI
jgi:hypothetical protein